MVALTPIALLSISMSLLAVAVDAKKAPGACFLHVPKDPLTAKGLATPFILKNGNCDQTDPAQQVFVEATIFDPDTKTFGVYHPLVINEGTEPAIKPIVPTLPKNAIVAIWFGANSESVTLTGHTKECVNGLSKKDIFGQVAFCNAENFFKAVHESDKEGASIPPIGTDLHGNPCPTTRHFGIIDQDPSDNVIATYLQKGHRFAQATKANRKKLGKGKFIEFANGSDNALVARLIDPAIKCTPFMAPSLMEPDVMLGSMALNELHATRQEAPVALIPAADPMVLSNGKQSLEKLNAYRQGVDQPLVTKLSQASTKAFCRNYHKIAPPYIHSIAKQLAKRPSPAADTANNLLTFMGQRYAASWVNLGCDKVLKKTSDITVTVDKNGVAIKIHFHQSKPIHNVHD